MKRLKELTVLVLLCIVSAAVIMVDVRSYRKYRDDLIHSEQTQLLTVAETVGGSLENTLTSELKMIDLLFTSPGRMKREEALSAAEAYRQDNAPLLCAVQCRDTAEAAGDAYIAGKHLADSGWYELEIIKNVPVDTGTLQLSFYLDLNEVYGKIVAPVRIGEGGYSVVKDKDLAIIMHHAKNQIGMDAIYDRKEMYPQLDLSSLQKWLDRQRTEEEGVGVIDTYIWDDPALKPVRRIVAFTTIRIQQEEWIVNSTLPMNELDHPLSMMLMTILILTGVYFVIAAGILYILNRARLRSEAQKREISYLQEINHGMETAAKQSDEIRHYQRIESLGMMASHIAHEFNNYLTPVMVYAELLENDSDLSDAGRDMVREIMHSTERAAKLSGELLDFSRQDSGARLHLMNLREETEDAVSVVSQLAPAKIHVTTDIMKEDMNVMGRDGMMQHILLNLSRNAFQAMENSERKELTITLQKTDQGAVLKVEDSGKGISRDALSRIFEPFYTTKGSHQGTGLGLSVIRNIMHTVNGTIDVASTPGEGTCFTLFFPAYEENSGSLLRDNGKTVCVDSDEAFIRSLKQNTSADNIEFITSEMMLISRLQKDSSYCSTVISGYTLQHMNGIELLETVRRLNPAIHVILAADSSDPDLQWYLNNRIIDRIILRSDLQKELRDKKSA